MSHPQIIQNSFDPRTTRDLLGKLNFVTFEQPAEDVSTSLLTE